MPIDPSGVAAIASGATQIGSSLLNAALTGKTNKQQRKWAEKQYGVQRSDALSDWNMQNAYNSPASQMQRYKDAKLNPNLIYNQQTNSPTVRSSDSGSWNPRAPEVNLDAAPVLSSYFDTQVKEQTINNLQKQGQVLEQEATLKKAQITDTLASASQKGVNTDRAQFDLGIESELRDVSLQTREQQLRKTTADTQYTLDNNDRQAVMNSASVQEALSRILNNKMQNSKMYAEKQQIQQQITNLGQDSQLKALDIKLKSQGIQPHDPIYMRVITQKLQQISKPLNNMYNKAKSWRSDMWNLRVKY